MYYTYIVDTFILSKTLQLSMYKSTHMEEEEVLPSWLKEE